MPPPPTVPLSGAPPPAARSTPPSLPPPPRVATRPPRPSSIGPAAPLAPPSAPSSTSSIPSWSSSAEALPPSATRSWSRPAGHYPHTLFRRNERRCGWKPPSSEMTPPCTVPQRWHSPKTSTDPAAPPIAGLPRRPVASLCAVPNPHPFGGNRRLTPLGGNARVPPFLPESDRNLQSSLGQCSCDATEG